MFKNLDVESSEQFNSKRSMDIFNRFESLSDKRIVDKLSIIHANVGSIKYILYFDRQFIDN